MKKYIKPVAQAINIDNEVILAGSLDVNTEKTTKYQYSKHGNVSFDYEDED